ncbi:hypothetical protein [Clostridium magnum]|nr:hypothetical protein [Clostridium magnum]
MPNHTRFDKITGIFKKVVAYTVNVQQIQRCDSNSEFDVYSAVT